MQSGTKLYLLTHQEAAASLFDGVNAFNSCDRQMFLNELYERQPELSPFFEQWYTGESQLWFNLNNGSTRIILSSNGLQQGCPAGSFLFCLGLAPILSRISLAIPDSFIGAIIDDLTVCSPIRQLPTVIEVVSHHLGVYNITLSLPRVSYIHLHRLITSYLPILLLTSKELQKELNYLAVPCLKQENLTAHWCPWVMTFTKETFMTLYYKRSNHYSQKSPK